MCPGPSARRPAATTTTTPAATPRASLPAWSAIIPVAIFLVVAGFFAYGLTRDVLLIDPTGWAVGTYSGVQTVKLAKNGDNERWMTVAEKMLICKNEKQGAVIRDLS